MAAEPEKRVDELYQCLQKHLGLHRQLLDTVRREKAVLVEANLKGLQECTVQKESLIEAIQTQERARLQVIGELARLWKKPLREMSLAQVIVWVQGFDLKRADGLRSVYQALQVLVKRIEETNLQSRELVLTSLANIDAMKRNVLGEANPRSATYTPHGQKTQGSGSSRLLSREA
jgi:flagellar biosynthesis/type III secretory pathway chaperone